MLKYGLPQDLLEKYHIIKDKIRQRLEDFSKVPESDYFYELCYCMCTPQSKAVNASKVVNELMGNNFFEKPFDASHILGKPENYIRFHNTKSRNLLLAREKFDDISGLLAGNSDPVDKRQWLADNILGFGMKESSHFLRNIGYRRLAILDRHILKNLRGCGVYDEVPKVGTRKNYLVVENAFLQFSDRVGIDMDELDLLFWSQETGEILK